MKLSVFNQTTPTATPTVAPWEATQPSTVVTEYQDEADLNPAPTVAQ